MIVIKNLQINHIYALRPHKGSIFPQIKQRKTNGWSAFGVVANVFDSYFIVNEFELQSRYYVLFWTNTFGKGIIPLIPQLSLK